MVVGVRKGAWSEAEDSLLRKCIEKYEEGKWHLVPLRAGLNRCRKSCRLRWLNYLRPSIKRGDFSLDEIDLIVRLHNLLGNRWSLIAGRLPGRTGNDVKNYWNTHQVKKSQAKSTKPTSTCTTTKKVKVFKPRPRIFIRHDNATFSSRVDKSTPIISKTNNGSITENNVMEFGGLFDGKEVLASSLFQLCDKEEEAMNRFLSEEIPSFVLDNDGLGDDDSNNKDRHKTIIWDSDVSEFGIDDMDIWGLLNNTQESI